MISFYSQLRCNLGWLILGFTSAFLHERLNLYTELFGTMTVPIIIIILLLLLLLLLLFTYVFLELA